MYFRRLPTKALCTKFLTLMRCSNSATYTEHYLGMKTKVNKHEMFSVILQCTEKLHMHTTSKSMDGS